MTNELGATKKLFYSKLTASSTIQSYVGSRVYDEVQPGGADWPMVIFQVVAAPDTLGVGGTRVLTHAVVRVKAITKGAGMQQGLNIASAIDATLHKAEGTYDTHYVTCHRVSAFSYSEVDSGEIYRHTGGEYRVAIHPPT